MKQSKILLALLLGLLTGFVTTMVRADNGHKALPVDHVKCDLSVMVLGSGGPMAQASGRVSYYYRW